MNFPVYTVYYNSLIKPRRIYSVSKIMSPNESICVTVSHPEIAYRKSVITTLDYDEIQSGKSEVTTKSVFELHFKSAIDELNKLAYQ
jgi:hypothetical protein